MEEFANVARARESYKTFSAAMSAGREVLRRAGVPDPPPIPEFEPVFRRMDAATRQKLYAELAATSELTPQEAIRLWTPLIRRAFAPKPSVD